jgi:hypothetical protein
MPPVSEQLALPGSRTNPKLVAARFLLKPGRKYEEAVKAFQPYDKVKEPNPEARAAGKALIAEGKNSALGRQTFIYVNNRLYAACGIKPSMPHPDLCRVASGFLRFPQELDKSVVALAA